MIEGAADSGAMGIIVGLAVRVVDQKACSVGGKAAVYEHIVTAVVDAAVKALPAQHIGKLVVLAEMGDIDTRTAIGQVAIRHSQRTVRTVTCIRAGDTAAGKAIGEAAMDHGISGRRSTILNRSSSRKQKAMPCPNLCGRSHGLSRASYRQVLYRAERAQLHRVALLQGFIQQQLCCAAHTHQGCVVRHIYTAYQIGSAAKLTSTIPTQ